MDLKVVSQPDAIQEVVNFTFYAQDDLQLDGFQFELEFDTDQFEFISALSSTLNLDKGNLSTKFIDEGKLLVSWNELRTVSVVDESSLFEIKFKQLVDDEIKTPFVLSNEWLRPELYLDRNEPIYELGLAFENNDVQLVQNVPNPFTDLTTVEFTSNTTELLDIEVVDLQGKQVIRKQIYPVLGNNTIQFSSNEFLGAGVYYLRLISEDSQSVIKMILIN